MEYIDVPLYGVPLDKLYQALCLWSVGETGRNERLKEQYKKMDDYNKCLAGRMTSNDEASWIWGDVFKQFKQDDPDICAVYFIENSYGDRVKIGYTKTLWRRFEEINQASGGECRILLAVPVQSRYVKQTERAFHLTYQGRRLGGEWFRKQDNGGDFVADIVYGLSEMCKREGVGIWDA